MRIRIKAGVVIGALSLSAANADPIITFETILGYSDGEKVGTARYCVVTPRVATCILGDKKTNQVPFSWKPDESVSDAISDLYTLKLTDSQSKLWDRLGYPIGPVYYRLTVATDDNKAWSLYFYPMQPRTAREPVLKLIADARDDGETVRERKLDATDDEIEALCDRLAAILQAAKTISTKPQQGAEVERGQRRQ